MSSDGALSGELTRAEFPLAGIVVAALGYFVDIYDLILFSIVRVPSLKALGFSGDQLLSNGVFLLNVQMAGMLLGGVLWGIWGDKRGRVSVLFGSILLYSVANLLNAGVTEIWSYAFFRLLAGIGLAGELGAGITLVSETMARDKRGYGTTIVASVGILGAVTAALLVEFFDWRISYVVGGVMGLCLLLLRVSVHESGMFEGALRQDVNRGDLLLLLSSGRRFLKYLSCIAVGLPCWFVIGILVTFAPEFGSSLGMPDLPNAGKAVMWTYIGLVAGDLASGLLSQYLRRRKIVMALFVGMALLMVLAYLQTSGRTPAQLYRFCMAIGFSVGYWAVLVTSAAEQFGTNLRATVTTTVPNFIRGAVVPMTILFNFLKQPLGIVHSAMAVGGIVFFFAFLGLLLIEESFSADLDFVEL